MAQRMRSDNKTITSIRMKCNGRTIEAVLVELQYNYSIEVQKDGTYVRYVIKDKFLSDPLFYIEARESRYSILKERYSVPIIERDFRTCRQLAIDLTYDLTMLFKKKKGGLQECLPRWI